LSYSKESIGCNVLKPPFWGEGKKEGQKLNADLPHTEGVAL
jgi:hypothetical protein